MTTMTDSMRQTLATWCLHLIYAGLVLFVGWLAGFILGRTLAKMIQNRNLGELIARLCIVAGTLAALPLAYRIVL
ncbi:hypothetical protein KXR69_25020 [Ralstonia holmesii]|uniref:mechanosensitive ion channel family protein n=1 Tax=Ralstonia holmesii TaxID=3058602 RepID=UPI003F169D09